MNKRNVLIIGRHPELLNKIMFLLKDNNFNVFGSINNEEAFTILKSTSIDAVVIGGGVDSLSRNLFFTEFPKINPTIKIVNGHPHSILDDLNEAFL